MTPVIRPQRRLREYLLRRSHDALERQGGGQEGGLLSRRHNKHHLRNLWGSSMKRRVAMEPVEGFLAFHRPAILPVRSLGLWKVGCLDDEVAQINDRLFLPFYWKFFFRERLKHVDPFQV